MAEQKTSKTGISRESPGAEPIQNGFEAAYCEYMRALQNAQIEWQKGVWEAYWNYVRAVQESQLDPRRGLEDPCSEYERTIRESRAAVRRRGIEAYGKYLKMLQNAWAGPDIEKLDVDYLESIGRSIMAAAYYGRADLYTNRDVARGCSTES